MNSGHSRLAYFGAAPLLIAVLLAGAAVMGVWAKLDRPQVYHDTTVGLITYVAQNKDRDFVALGLLVVLGAAAAVGISIGCHRASPDGPASPTGVAINQFLLLAMVPAGWRLAVSAFSPQLLPLPPIRTLALIALLAAIVIWALSRYGPLLQPTHVFDCGGAVLLTLFFAPVSALAIALAVARIIPGAALHLHGKTQHWAQIAMILAAAALVASYVTSRSVDLFQQRSLACLRIAQLPLPLLFFMLVPAPLVDPLHRFATPYPHLLVLTIAGGCLLSWWFMARRFFPSAGSPQTRWWRRILEIRGGIKQAVAPAAVAALTVLVYCNSLSIPTINFDPFHWGEQALPWQQLHDFGKRPYVDFVPIHGLMAYMRGAANQYFFDGSAAHYDACDVMLDGVAGISIALAASCLLPPLAALFVLMAILPSIDRMYFIAPSLFLLASPRLLRAPLRLLIVWVVVGFLMVAYNAALGPALVVGSLPLAAWGAWRLARQNWVALLLFVAALAAIAAACVLIKPIELICHGFFLFVLNNEWTNNVGNGVAWIQGWGQRVDDTTGIGTSQLLWECYRFGWIAVFFAGVALAWRELFRPAAARNAPLLALAACSAGTLLISSPWVMGRIDAGYLSRTGAMAQMAIFDLVPAIVLLNASVSHIGRDLLVLATLVGLTYPLMPTRLDPNSLVDKAEWVRQVPPDVTVVDGAKLDLPRLGQVILSTPDNITPLPRLRKALNEFLRPKETFLDLTNGSGRYFYLDMPFPVLYPAYVACNVRLQGEMMKQLNDHPVHAVLVGPSELFDGTPQSLRCYELYRRYVLAFRIVQRDEFVLLVDPARMIDPPPRGSEPQLKLLDAMFTMLDLQRIPLSWGQSYATLADRFQSIATTAAAAVHDYHQVKPLAQNYYQPIGINPWLTYAIPPRITDGTVSDFLRLKFDISLGNPGAALQAMRINPAPTPATTSAEPEFALRWINADGSFSDPIYFFARPGNVLVPLGSYPRWLLGKHPRFIRIDLVNPISARKFRIADVEWLKLKPL